ncbi:unnamed protein product [Closterium sp. NIES-54]
MHLSTFPRSPLPSPLQLKTGYTIAMLRRHNRGYSRHGLYRELAGTYKQINRAIAADDRTALRHLVTESAFTVRCFSTRLDFFCQCLDFEGP